MQDLEMATLGWVDWFNNRRLPGPIENIPPAEAEETFYAQRDVLDMVAQDEAIGLRQIRGDTGDVPVMQHQRRRIVPVRQGHGKSRTKRGDPHPPRPLEPEQARILVFHRFRGRSGSWES
ncbi:hypothetical protein GGQ68_004386 [Sagittula marina]|uniref:Transposase n=1 Tax=Sagittula marina TaxID=943940 RepID=A0A7W6DRS2_9RHOB|nr:hypothetical protein [Sagittula marina]